MSKLFKLLDDIKRHVDEIIRNNKSLVLSLDIEIHEGGIRNWKFFTKNKM